MWHVQKYSGSPTPERSSRVSIYLLYSCIPIMLLLQNGHAGQQRKVGYRKKWMACSDSTCLRVTCLLLNLLRAILHSTSCVRSRWRCDSRAFIGRQCSWVSYYCALLHRQHSHQISMSAAMACRQDSPQSLKTRDVCSPTKDVVPWVNWERGCQYWGNLKH